MRLDDKASMSNDMDELKKTVEYLRQIKEKLQRSEEEYRFLAENSIDAIWRLDAQFQFVYVSSAVENILGYQPEEMIGRHLFSILTQESINVVIQGYAKRQPAQAAGKKWESSTYTVEAIHKNRYTIWVEVTVNPIFSADDQLIGYNGITRDISERRKNEELIRQYAFRDPLTNLPNRRSFEEELERIVDRHRELKKSFAVMFLDVDGLKQVNDAYGHAAGDTLLQAVANRISLGLRDQDFIARLAGDEFMAILPGVTDNSAAEFIVASLLERFHKAIAIGDNEVRISVSIGITFFPEDADAVTALMSYADKAMYAAKKNGGGSYLCYSQLKQ